jgi:CheY-like chemotaxis protein
MEKKQKVLLIEDTPLAQLAAKMVLTNLGFEIEIAPTGEDALVLFEKNQYAFVLVDIGLPGMDGIETAIQLRKQEASGNPTPMFALTANKAVSCIKRCLDAGIDDFIAKPVSRERMVEELTKHHIAF